jgi:hypothetical protein
MKKICLCIAIAVISLITFIKSNAQNAKPEKIYSIIKIWQPAAWYKEQADLWKKEVNKDSKNANAWYNYYNASRCYLMTATDSTLNDFTGMDTKKLVDVVNQMEKNVPDSYEFNLLKLQNVEWAADSTFYRYLKKVYEMDTTRIDAYDDLAAYYDRTRDTVNLKKIMNKWYSSNDFSPGFLALNYNVLMPLEKNAILFVTGDNLVFPAWVLQYVMGLRCDVKILLAGLFQYDSYNEGICKELKIEPFKKKLSDYSDEKKYEQAIAEYITQKVTDRSIYFSVYLNSTITENLKENLYSEGLVYDYSKEKYDNIAVIERNYEKIFLKDYFSYSFTNDISQIEVYESNLNYIPAFLNLYVHYKVSGDNDKAEKIMSLCRTIVGKTEYKDVYTKTCDQYENYYKELLKEE